MNHAWLRSGVFVLALAAAGPASADEAAVYYNQGLVLKRQGKTAEAIAEMKKAIAARKDYAAAWFSLGNL
jgi:Tfp pilus assembly protein PilF